jgi:sulfur-carrier protein
MAVKVRIPTQLRSATGGASEASVEGAGTVAEVLDALFVQFGELRERIADEHGSLRRFVNLYIAGEDIRFLDGIETTVPDGAEVTILPAVAGG